MKHVFRKLVGSATITAIMGMSAVWMAPPSYADEITECADVTIIGARGTSEGQEQGAIAGFGDSLSVAAKVLHDEIKQQRITTTIKMVAVQYPASGPFESDIPWSSYALSVLNGRGDLQRTSEAIARKCPATTFVMMGYSQGAHVVHKATESFSQSVLDKLAYVWLLSDPSLEHKDIVDPALAFMVDESGVRYNSGILGVMRAVGLYIGNSDMLTPSPYRSELLGRVIEVCHSEDTICNHQDTYQTNFESPETEDEIAMSLAGVYGKHGSAYKDPSIHRLPTQIATPRIVDMAESEYVKVRQTFPIAVSRCQVITNQVQLLQDKSRNYNGDCQQGPAGMVVQGGTGRLVQVANTCLSDTQLSGPVYGNSATSSPPSNCQALLNSWADTISLGGVVSTYLPIYGNVTTSGTTEQYTLVAYREFVVLGWKLDGTSSLPNNFRNTSTSTALSCTGTCRGLIGYFR